MQTAIKFKYLDFTDFAITVFWDYYTLSNKNTISAKYELVKLNEVLQYRKDFIKINDNEIYKRCRVQIDGKGVVLRDEIYGSEIKTKKQQLCKTDDFLVAEIDAKVGGYGIVPEDLEGAVVSGHYFLFDINKLRLLPEYLGIIVKHEQFSKQVKSTGSTNYAAIRPYHVLEYIIPLPAIDEQKYIANKYLNNIKEIEALIKQADELNSKIEVYLFNALGIEKKVLRSEINTGLQLINFDEIFEWGFDKILDKSNMGSTKFAITSIVDNPNLVIQLLRGKSPKYKEGTSKVILNQKCNRWNEIDTTFAKSVDDNWLDSVSIDNFTKEGDILINSTGEGTIGRASFISKENEGLMYDSHLLLLRLNRKIVNAELFVEIFNSSYGQNQVNILKSAQATKQTELGISNLSKIQFPLPDDLDYQNDIISAIKKLRKEKATLLQKAYLLRKETEDEFERSIFG